MKIKYIFIFNKISKIKLKYDFFFNNIEKNYDIINIRSIKASKETKNYINYSLNIN